MGISTAARLCVLALLGTPAWLHAQWDGSAVRAEVSNASFVIEGTSVSALPGRAATVRFIITNRASRGGAVSISATLPTGWRIVSGVENLTIEHGATEIVLLQVAVPVTAVQGDYAVVLTAVDGAQAYSGQSKVQVRAVRRVTIAAGESPRFVIAGESYRTTLTITNRGNTAERPAVTLRSEKSFPAHLDTVPLIEPGHTATIAAKVDVPTGGPSGWTHHLSATLVGAASSGNTVSSAVLVVGRSVSAPSPIYALPTVLRLTSTTLHVPGTTAGRPGLALAIASNGTLVDGGSTHVDLLLRGPQPKRSFTGERDEYRLSIANPNFDLTAGDQFFTTSPLSEPGRFGTGLSARLTLGPISLSGFGTVDRWSGRPGLERGVGAGADSISLGDVTAGIRAHVLQRTGNHPGTLGTVSSVITPGHWLRIEGELGASLGSSQARARRASISGAHPLFEYDLRVEQSDPLYATDTPNNAQDHARVLVRPFHFFNLAATTDTRRAVSVDSGGTLALLFRPTGRISSSDVGATFWNFLQLGARQTENALVGQPATNGERVARLRLNLGFHALRVRTTAEEGVSWNADDEHRRPLSQRTVDATLSLNTRLTFNAFAERAEGRRWYMRSDEDRRTVGGGVNTHLGSSTTLNFSGVLTQAASGSSVGILPGSTGWFDGAITQDLGGGREFAVRSRGATQGAWPAMRRSIEISYATSFGMPVGRSATQGRIRARVMDAESGSPVRNTLVRLGDRATITDNDGIAMFGGIAPGSYHAQVEREAGLVDAKERALTVAALAGRTEDITLALTRAASIGGRVRLFLADSTGDDRTGKPLTGVTVTLADGDMTRVVRTDEQGRFRVDELHAGVWNITLDSGALPRWTDVQGGNPYVVVLAPGGDRTVDLKVVVRKRTMRMVTP